MRFVRVWVVGVLPLFLSAAFVLAQGQPNQRPVISHDPVRVAVKGQPVTVLARVTDDSGYVKSVTLFYSVSQDAAPFRFVMKSSGTSMYYGTIPAAVLQGSDKVSYYIEAMDHVDATQETPWYSVNVREPQQAPTAQAQPVIQQQAPRQTQDRGGVSWKTVGVIGVGAAAVVGGAVLLGSSGGGDGDSDSGGSSSGTVEVGDYDGDVTECFTVEGGSQSCETHAMTINISASGIVSSSTLHPGAAMETTLRGNTFSLAAELGGSSTGGIGQVVYNGTVVDDRIIGDISGTEDTASGVGTYSGTFSANKRN